MLEWASEELEATLTAVGVAVDQKEDAAPARVGFINVTSTAARKRVFVARCGPQHRCLFSS